MILVLAAAVASQPNVTFVGVRLWELASYPSCDSNPPEDKICTNKEDNDTYRVDLRAGRPKWIKMNTLVMLLHDKPVAAEISTIGYEGQAKALDDLEVRYGKPISLTSTNIENAFGAHFRIVHARWRLKDGAAVELDGAKTSLDEGEVRWLQ